MLAQLCEVRTGGQCREAKTLEFVVVTVGDERFVEVLGQRSKLLAVTVRDEIVLCYSHLPPEPGPLGKRLAVALRPLALGLSRFVHDVLLFVPEGPPWWARLQPLAGSHLPPTKSG
jgi:hypothetical protein